MSAPAQAEYILGTHEEELRRLGFQHRVWGAQAFRLWERAGFGHAQTLIDVGCGPGFASLDLARLVGPTGSIIGVDESARFLRHLESQADAQAIRNIHTREADVQRLPLDPGKADGAYARWVLCFVPDPRAVVAGVARALRAGGVFAIQDYFNYRNASLAPRSAVMEKVVMATDSSWRTRGGDPDIAGRLPALLSECGFEVREVKAHLRVARPGSALWQWPTTFFLGYLPTLVQLGLITTADQTEFEREWKQRTNDPSTFFVTPPVYDIIAIKR